MGPITVFSLLVALQYSSPIVIHVLPHYCNIQIVEGWWAKLISNYVSLSFRGYTSSSMIENLVLILRWWTYSDTIRQYTSRLLIQVLFINIYSHGAEGQIKLGAVTSKKGKDAGPVGDFATQVSVGSAQKWLIEFIRNSEITAFTGLTHWGRVTHISVSKLNHHWFR